MTKPPFQLWQNAGRLALMGVLCLPLLAYAYLGEFNRLMSDDYCSAAYAKIGGVLGGAVLLYLGWTGRFMASLLGTFMGSFGAAAPPLLPAAGLTAWLAVLFAVLYSFNLAPRLAERLFSSALMGALVLATTVAISPKVSQSLFWSQAAACSTPSLILATVYPCLIQKTPQKGYGYWLGFILAFTAGGFSETYVALQTSIFAVLLLAAITASRPGAINKTMAWYLTGFLGSFTALIIVFIAPGNLVRQHLFPPPPGLMELLKITLASWLAFWVRTLTTPTILAGLVSLLGISITAGAGLLFDKLPQPIPLRSARQALLWLPAGAAFLLVTCFVPAAYGESGPPPERTLVIPYYFLVCALAAWGYFAGCLIRQKYTASKFPQAKSFWAGVTICCLCLLALNPLWATYIIMNRQPAISHFAAQWDTANRMILDARSQGLAQVTVPRIDNWEGIEDLGPDPNFWVNRCANIYYGITIQTE